MPPQTSLFNVIVPNRNRNSRFVPNNPTPVLIVGIPRSGTRWMGRVLGHARHVTYIHEPDSEQHSGFAVRAKKTLGRFPVLNPEDTPTLYESLWRHAFDRSGFPGGRLARRRRRLQIRASAALLSDTLLAEWLSDRSKAQGIRFRLGAQFAPPIGSQVPARRLVVKSVHAALAMDWVYERFRPRVVVALRHPMEVIASMKELGWLGSREVDGWPELDLLRQGRVLGEHSLVRQRYLDRWGLAPPGPGWSHLRQAAYHVGLLACALQESAESHPEWCIVTHEWLCEDPSSRFRELAETLGLEWTEETEGFINERNRAGTGFQTRRLAPELPNRWRQRLTVSEAREALKVLDRFPLSIDPSWDWPGKTSPG